MSNIVVWKLQVQIITYFEWTKNLKWLLIFTILNIRLVCSIFLIGWLFNFVADQSCVSLITENCALWNKIQEDIFNCFSKYTNLFINIFFCYRCFLRIIIDFSLDKSVFADLQCQISRSLGGGLWILKLSLAYIIWWWHFRCKDELTPDSITRLGWETKIKSMQEDDASNMWVGSLISSCMPNCDVMPSVIVPS